MKILLTAATCVLLAGSALAQNYNAFKQMDGFHDVTIKESGDMFTLSLGADPTVTRNGKTSAIKDVTGFWLLGANGNVSAVQDPLNGWQFKDNSGGGRSADGWFTQNKNGIGANQSVTFDVKGFSAAQLTNFGLMLHANGIPAHVKLNKQPVPEPVSMLALAGGFFLLRRKKASSK